MKKAKGRPKGTNKKNSKVHSLTLWTSKEEKEAILAQKPPEQSVSSFLADLVLKSLFF